jgi:hypothetical protein
MSPISRAILSGLTCACAALTLNSGFAEETGADDDLAIGLSKKEQRKESDRAKGLALCKQFAYDRDSFVDSKALDAEGAKLAKETANRTLLISCLDPKEVREPELRRGALHALNAAKFASPEVSRALTAVAVADPNEDVRKDAVTSIKLRKDDLSTKQIIDFMLSTYDEQGNVKALAEHDNSIDAARVLAESDSRVYQTLLEKAYYATIETRVTNTELVNLVTRQIDAFTVNSGAQVNLILRLSFPIQFPELAITKVRTTVKAPCASVQAMEEITGQVFGEDVEKWAKWIRKHN